MATNESQESARRAQDLDAPQHFQREDKGTYHWGRGGEGNMMSVGENGEKVKEHNAKDHHAESKERRKSSKERRKSSMGEGERRGSGRIIDKGKEMLGIGKHKNPGGSAIED